MSTSTTTQTIRVYFWKAENIYQPPASKTLYLNWYCTLKSATLGADIYMEPLIGLDSIVLNGKVVGTGDQAAHSTFNVADKLIKGGDNICILNYTVYGVYFTSQRLGLATVYLDLTLEGTQDQIQQTINEITNVNQQRQQQQAGDWTQLLNALPILIPLVIMALVFNTLGKVMEKVG